VLEELKDAPLILVDLFTVKTHYPRCRGTRSCITGSVKRDGFLTHRGTAT
jgi:hypothetical protein